MCLLEVIMCDHNKKFLFYVLKNSDVLDILVPILYHLNDARADQCKFVCLCACLFVFVCVNWKW